MFVFLKQHVQNFCTEAVSDIFSTSAFLGMFSVAIAVACLPRALVGVQDYDCTNSLIKRKDNGKVVVRSEILGRFLSPFSTPKSKFGRGPRAGGTSTQG